MYVHKAAGKEDRASVMKGEQVKRRIGIDKEKKENWWLQPTAASVKKYMPLKNEDKQPELGWL